MKRTLLIPGFMMFFVAIGHAQWAHAVLGGGVDTIAVDRKVLQAVHRATTAHKGYTVEEIVSDAMTVREYVSPSGVVFGIAWNGYVNPDLTQLLGAYWGEYSAARQKAERRYGTNRQKLSTNSTVVEKWGHMRNLQGRAYVPSLIPSGVGIGEIK
ncbi:MAG: DUF2844 domain-containing protein [Desulfuromonadaceae bacterium]|nr:DUF2844 domain-containing protein [Desulfuromonadaceae bacterium]